MFYPDSLALSTNLFPPADPTLIHTHTHTHTHYLCLCLSLSLSCSWLTYLHVFLVRVRLHQGMNCHKSPHHRGHCNTKQSLEVHLLPSDPIGCYDAILILFCPTLILALDFFTGFLEVDVCPSCVETRWRNSLDLCSSSAFVGER